jgi:hypothetical protein
MQPVALHFGGSVVTVAFSPEGALLLSVGADPDGAVGLCTLN